MNAVLIAVGLYIAGRSRAPVTGRQPNLADIQVRPSGPEPAGSGQ
jgi:hypothetical protein